MTASPPGHLQAPLGERLWQAVSMPPARHNASCLHSQTLEAATTVKVHVCIWASLESQADCNRPEGLDKAQAPTFSLPSSLAFTTDRGLIVGKGQRSPSDCTSLASHLQGACFRPPQRLQCRCHWAQLPRCAAGGWPWRQAFVLPLRGAVCLAGTAVGSGFGWLKNDPCWLRPAGNSS